MTKPASAGPRYILKSSVPKASRMLDSLLHNYTRAGYGTDAARAAMWNSMQNMVAWHAGEPEVSWLLDCNRFTRTALLAHASTLELRGEATAEQIKELRDAAASFSKWLKDTAEPAPVVAVRPPQDSYPSAMPRKAPKPFVPAITATVTVEINGEPHKVSLPAEHRLAATVLDELRNVVFQVGTLASVPIGTTAQNSAQHELDHSLSLLRALGVLDDGGEIEDRHRLDYQPFSAAQRVERARERDMVIGSR